MLTVAFWKGAGERALKTFIQTLISSALIGVGAATTAWEVDWLTVLWLALGVALLAAFGSVATSLGSADFVAGKPNVVTVIPDAGYVEPDEPKPTEPTP